MKSVTVATVKDLYDLLKNKEFTAHCVACKLDFEGIVHTVHKIDYLSGDGMLRTSDVIEMIEEVPGIEWKLKRLDKLSKPIDYYASYLNDSRFGLFCAALGIDFENIKVVLNQIAHQGEIDFTDIQQLDDILEMYESTR